MSINYLDYIIGTTYHYAAWGNHTGTDLISVINENTDLTNIIFIAPEEHEVGSLFQDLYTYTLLDGYLNYNHIAYDIIVSVCNNFDLNHKWPYKDQSNFHFWDDFFIYMTLNYNWLHGIKPLGHSTKITKHFTSLNGRAHSWRCMFVDYMYKEGLFDHGYVSWHNSDNFEYDYKFKFWTPKIINFDKNWVKSTNGIFDIFLPPEEEFQNSLFSIISESHADVLKVTEKTYLPIFHKRPFIVYGPQHFHKFLKLQGFVLFDEIFDYGFDEIEDNELRCQEMMKQAKKILEHDPNVLCDQLTAKVEYNYQNLFNRVIDETSLTVELKDLLVALKGSQFDFYHSLSDIKNQTNFIEYMEKHK